MDTLVFKDRICLEHKTNKQEIAFDQLSMAKQIRSTKEEGGIAKQGSGNSRWMGYRNWKSTGQVYNMDRVERRKSYVRARGARVSSAKNHSIDTDNRWTT